VEGLTAIIFTVLYWRFGLNPEFFIYMALSCVLIVISFIDIEHWIIPDELSVPGIIAGLLISFIYPKIQGEVSRFAALGSSFFGVVFGFVSLYLIDF
jgi:leader peptidase (prepilin peptidase)/N-methyltransferase